MNQKLAPRQPYEHEPTPTDIMIYHLWPAEPPLKSATRAPLPMLPMPPIPGRVAQTAPQRRPALVTLRVLAPHPADHGRVAQQPPARRSRRGRVQRLSFKARVATLAASTLLCGVLFGSAILWFTHHASAPVSARLALDQDTLRA
jgi:hypothetical protein